MRVMDFSNKTLIGNIYCDVEQFEARMGPVDPRTGCQLWTGDGWHAQGYGMMIVWPEHAPVGRTNRTRTMMCAHRLSYIIHNRVKLDRRDWILHRCCNPACVNPQHLVIGTGAMRADFRRAAGLPSKIQPTYRHEHPQRGRSYKYSIEQMVYAYYHTLDEIRVRFQLSAVEAGRLRGRCVGKSAYPWLLKLLPQYDKEGNLL